MGGGGSCLPAFLYKTFAMLLPHLLGTGCPGWQEAAVALGAGDLHPYRGSCAEQTGERCGFADHKFYIHLYTLVSSGFIFLCFHIAIVGGIELLGSASRAIAAALSALCIPPSSCPRAVVAFIAFWNLELKPINTRTWGFM